MNDYFGFKELYDVAIKSTYPMKIGDREIETGEVIAFFDKIQLGNLQEIKTSVSANGGFDNRSHVYWESTKEIRILLTQGIFSKEQFSILKNAKLLEPQNGGVRLWRREKLESDDKGIVTTRYSISKMGFIYDATTGEKITDYRVVDNEIMIPDSYKDVIVDYWFIYDQEVQTFKLGSPLTEGFLTLEAKTRFKEESGKVKTGIITIPKLKLITAASIQLGRNAEPTMGRLEAVALPTGAKGNTTVLDMLILTDDIDSDI